MRWWTYQKERFPLLANGLLVAAFSSCAVLYSSSLSGGSPPSFTMFGVAFVSCLLFFLQLRIADEFKDAEEDARYRPYRPVPRGLVTLRELGWLFATCAIIQLTLAILLAPSLSFVLLLAWLYLALMSVEFFCRDWLKTRHITYLWTHMLIMPIVDFYATAAYWLPTQGIAPAGLGWFLAASFTNGLVIELGRKIRVPVDEEEGVPTYSKLWGSKKASAVWLGCMTFTAIFGILAAQKIATVGITTTIFSTGVALSLILVIRFHKTLKSGKIFELAAGLWTLTLYLTLGILPLLLK